MILYVPNGLTILSNVPVLMWIHGGSFIVGSATGPGIDGSKLAIATNSIVAVVQHRLGALGFMAPSGSTNLAVKDMVTALQFLRNVVTFFGGDRNRITIAGQSSGANMVRALLAAPTASSLFSSGILQSDPMDYGFLAPSVQQEFQAYFNSLVNCNPSDTACQNSLSIDSIIGAQMNLFGDAINIDPSATQAEPIRPVRDGTFITTSLTSSTNFPAQNKPLLISSVANEAGGAIYSAFTSALPQAAFSQVVSGSFGSPRSNAILASSYYQGSGDDARPQLEKLGTDSVWRCAKWTFARSWVQSGGSAYVGLYTVGATYPGNEAVPFCTQPGSVCHQDDIEIVFGTTQNPSTAQSALTTEMQQRYKQFLSSGNPNSQGLPNWAPATSSNVHPQLLGSSGEAPVGACDPSFWGQAVQYDYQVYNI
jgi:carboxylesterase type B